VQQQAPGKSLFDLVQSGWHTNEAEVKDIAQQVLAILTYLHSLDPPVIHRDIKPHNLIRSDDGKIYLVDFGAVQNTYYNTLMQGSTVVGTYGYMAPEQFRGQALPATDLYSLGATLLYLLTHRSPAELPQDTLKLDFRNSVDISESFADWLDKILDPDIDDRFTNADQALAKLFASKKKQQSKVITSIAAGILTVGLITGFNSYKWFFLSNIGFYPSEICNSLVWHKFTNQGGSINWLNIRSIKKNSWTVSCLFENALENKDFKIIKILVKNGVDINRKDNQGQTPLFYWTNDLDITEFLINSGADVNTKNNYGQTALFKAVAYTDLTKLILQHGANVNAHYQKVAQLLIKHGANVNTKDNHGVTPLFRAKDKTMTLILIKNGADVNVKSNLGITPLYRANEDVAQVLIENGAYAIYKDGTSQNIFYNAIKNGRQDQIQKLINIGIDLKIDPNNRPLSNLLYEAISNGHKDLIDLLITNDIIIDFDSEFGVHFLLKAIKGNNKKTLKSLIEIIKDININNEYGHTPLLEAIRHERIDLIRLLIDSGAHINAESISGYTPLTEAARNGDREIVELLITRGADINLKNGFHRNALFEAARNERKDITQLLINYGANTNSVSNMKALNRK
ncbi:MAG: ankyrin repeat domain-containing protein, partial [Cyanobacteria bacterium P01_A01_bin.45]